MSEAVVDDIVAVLPPLLNALEALAFFQRNLHPPAFGSVMNAIGASLIVLSLLVNFNLSALLMEVFWVLISFIGIYRYFRLKTLKSRT